MTEENTIQDEITKQYTVETSGYERTCGECTMCCQGWLSGEAYEYVFTKNHPCHFLDKCGDKCTIYSIRPQVCQDFKCEWLRQPVAFPLWMKPSLTNVIVTWRIETHNNEEFGYWSVRECGEKIDSNVLNWLIQQAIQHEINIRYEVDGVGYCIGTDVFKEWHQLNSY
jgi:uncharacterized cysteine cluster protein YcgN (CxxCxxCC family)